MKLLADHVTAVTAPERQPARKLQRQILIADDDASVRALLARVLVGEGYGVWVAAAGTEVLSLAARVKPDVLLLDPGIRRGDSSEACSRLSTACSQFPVVLLTHRANRLPLGWAAGARAMLEKPLDFPTLLQVIKAVVAESEQARQGASAEEAGRP